MIRDHETRAAELSDHKAHALKLLGGDLRTAIRAYLTQVEPEDAIRRVVTLLARAMEDEADATKRDPGWRQAADRARALMAGDAVRRPARDQGDDAERAREWMRQWRDQARPRGRRR